MKILTVDGDPRSRAVIDITERKRSEDELKVSLKEVIDLKAALDEVGTKVQVEVTGVTPQKKQK